MAGLKRAIEADNINNAKKLINRGANLELEQGWYRPLLGCITHDRLEIAKFLIEVGANTTRPVVEERRTPLYHAICVGSSLAMVKLLLENGADLTMDECLIIFAVRKNNLEVVKLLFEYGANLNVVDSNGCTPLITWVCNNNRNCDILKFLVENGANVNFVDGQGETALVKCVRLMNIPAIKYLIANEADANVKNADDETPLSLALSNVDLRTFKLLIEAGADPELASEAIEATSKKYFRFAAYISELREAKDVKNPQLTNKSAYCICQRRAQRRAGGAATPKET